MMMTAHSTERQQQRGIPTQVLEVLLEFGESRQRHGAEVFYMTRRSRSIAQQQLGRKAYAKVADRLGVYAVRADDGYLLTCAHRLKRLKL